MVRSFGALLFIGCVAAIAIWVATRPTVIRGDVLESTLLPRLRKNGIEGIECEPKIPFTAVGATFSCVLFARDGSRARRHYTMSRSGQIASRQ